MDALRIRPLTADLIGDFVTLFGPQGACYGCWCTYFLLRPRLRQAMTGDERRDHMIERIRHGPPPGLIGHAGNDPVAWMQIGPRAEVPEWNNAGRVSAPMADGPADDPAVWAISCFFLARPWRGRGLSHQMIAAGIAHARGHGARMIEAAPMIHSKQPKSIALFVGPGPAFLKAGFHEVACRKENRPLMRLML